MPSSIRPPKSIALPRRGPLSLVALTIVLLAGLACSPPAAPAPTVSPTKPAVPAAASPASTAAAVKPATSPAASPAASPVAKPAVSPVATGVTATDAPKPAGFPTQPITWVIPYTPGGAFDVIPRGVAPALSRELGVPVVVQNVPGAEGYNRIFRAAPDGYTLGMVDLVGELGLRFVQQPVYDVTQFVYLGRINNGINLVVGAPSGNAKSLQQLRNAPESVRCGTFGGLSTPAVQCILLAERLGFKANLVRFPGPAELVVGTVRGDADLGSLGISLWLDHISKGNVLPVMVWADAPDPRAPGVPTLQDAGAADLAVLSVQRAVAVSPGTPPDRAAYLTAALARAVQSEEVQTFLRDRQFETNPQFGAEFTRTVTSVQQILTRNEATIKRFVQGS